MGAFASGFKLGQNAYQQGLDNKDREGIRKRQDEEFQWRAEDRARLSKDREGIDTAIKSFQATQGGIYDGTQAKFDSPMVGGEMGPQMEPAMPNPAMGLKPRAPTALETNQGLAGIAGAQRDVNAMGRLATEAGTLRIDQKFNDAMKAYKGDPDQIGSTIQYVNGNSKSLTMGAPDKNGLVRMSIVTPDKNAEFIKLSKQDQAQLYAAGSIMSDDPKRALEIMSGINKNMAAAFAAENGLTKLLADNTNDVSTKSASMSNDAKRTANDTARVGIAAGAAKRAAENDRLGKLMPFVDANGQPTFGEAAMVGGQPTIRPVNVTGGLRMPPAQPSRAQEAALKTYYESVAGMPEAPQAQRDKLAAQLGITQFVGGGGGLSFGGPAAGAPAGEPGAAAPVQVPGRPYYSEDTRKLEQIAKRPRGVSSGEAADAQRELDARRGEARMSGL